MKAEALKKASAFFRKNIAEKALNLDFKPYFISPGYFAFKRESFAAGKKIARWVMRDTSSGTEFEIFDHKKFARALSKELGSILSPDDLRIAPEEYSEKGLVFASECGRRFCWKNDALTALPEKEAIPAPSLPVTEKDGFLYTAISASPINEEKMNIKKVVAVFDDMVYFLAAGAEENTNTLHPYLYRVPTTGGKPQILSKRKGCQEIFFSPDGAWYLAKVSASDIPQTTFLYDKDGKELEEVVSADLSAFDDIGFSYPFNVAQSFSDGRDNRGFMLLPYDFDPSKQYPIVEYTGEHPITFEEVLNCDLPMHAIASLGVIVCSFTYPGLPIVLQNLAETFTFLDISRTILLDGLAEEQIGAVWDAFNG